VQLLPLVSNASSVSVVGMVKNAGKTVTLNHLIREAAEAGIRLGLTSTGRDGEQRDVITELPKPSVHVPAGSLVATAQAGLEHATAEVDILLATRHVTRMGRVVIARVTKPGRLELIGPKTMKQIAEVLGKMKRLGAEMTLVDGAFDRIASAAPGITDATILATGAALSASMTITVAKTQMTKELFELTPPPDTRLGILAYDIVSDRKVAFIGRNYERLDVPVRTALGQSEAIARHYPHGARALVLGGSLTDSIIETVIKLDLSGKLPLIVADGTRVFLDTAVWRRFLRAGGSLYCLNPINLVAVTVNPTSPFSPGYNPDVFLAAMGAALYPVPVFDLVANKSANTSMHLKREDTEAR